MTSTRSSSDVRQPLEMECARLGLDGGAVRCRDRRAVARVWTGVCLSVLACGLVFLFASAPVAAADPSGVVLNEVNCVGLDWVELVNTGADEVSLAGWLLTDDPLDRVPPRDDHRMRFGAAAVLAPGARLVVSKGSDGFPFGLSCGDDTLRLANAADALVDAFTLPVLASGELTLGRAPDGTGSWTVTLPTAGSANVVSTGTATDDPAWLYDPLQVTEIDLEAGEDALAQLALRPDEYVEARITLRSGTETYGPYLVGLRLKGHATFRTLAGKAAFKVKFGYALSGQRFHGLKGLTLNNMTQDPSMIAEATTSLMLQAAGAATARVGYAYVRLNGSDYGLYANVETIDAVMAQRFAGGTQHVFEGNPGVDVSPGREGEFEVGEGSSTDLSDLAALATANAGSPDGWWERMQPVADLAEMTRAWAGEHYTGHWDSYSVSTIPALSPNNYYLHSDLAGRFTLIPSGTDQTWLERPAFGAHGNGVLIGGCAADVTCRQLYIEALRQIAASPAVAALPSQARAIRAAIAPWRALDPRREQSVADGEAQADIKLATIDGRRAELAAWLTSPSFGEAEERPIFSGGDGTGSSDLSVIGTVEPASSPVGGSHVWRLQVQNSASGSPSGVVLDIQFSPNIAYGLSQVTRGSGCVLAGAGLHCVLDWLGAAADASSKADVVIGTNVTGLGEVSMTATASFAGVDPTPSDDTLVLTANTAPPVAQPVTATPVVPRPVLGKAVVLPAKPVAGRRFTLSLPVTRSDTGKPLLTGTMECTPSVAGKAIRHTDSFKAGKAQLSLVVPQTAKGKLLKVELTIKASGRSAVRTYAYAVR